MSQRADDKFDHNFNQNYFVHNHKRQYHKNDVHTYRKFSISMTSSKLTKGFSYRLLSINSHNENISCK
jgi:hypothetical protein